MSFLGGVGNFFHRIGTDVAGAYHDVFGGGDTVTTTTTQAPLRKPSAQQNNAPQQNQTNAITPPKTPDPYANDPLNPNNLVKANKFSQGSPSDNSTPPGVPANASKVYRDAQGNVTGWEDNTGSHLTSVGSQQNDQAIRNAVNPPESFGHHLLRAAGIEALGFGRVGTGLVKGVTELPDMAVHAATYIPRKIAGDNSTVNDALSAYNEGIDQVTNDINKPVDWASTQLDKAASRMGPGAKTGYKVAQVGGNILTLIPGAEALAGKASQLIRGGRGAVEAADATLPAANTLTKAGSLDNTAADTLPEAGIAGEAGGEELAPGMSTSSSTETPPTEPTPTTGTIETPGNPAVEVVRPRGTPTAPTEAASPGTAVPTPSVPAEAAPNITPTDINAPAAPVEADKTPAFIRKQEAQVAADQAAKDVATNYKIDNGPLARPTFMHKQDLQAVIDKGQQDLDDFINAHPEATAQDIENARTSISQQVMDNIKKLQDARNVPTPVEAGAPGTPPAPPVNPVAAVEAVAENKPVVPVADAQGNPVVTSAETKAREAQGAGINPNPTPEGPPNPALDQIPAQQSNVLEQPASTTGGIKSERHYQTVLNATKDANLKDAYEGSALAKNNPSYEELKNTANDVVSQKSVPQLIKEYGAGNSVGNPQQYYEHLAAIRELDNHPDVPEAVQAAANAYKSMFDWESNNGYNLGATRIAYDEMPTSMKVASIRNIVEKAGGDIPVGSPDYDRLMQAADLQGKLAQTAQAAEDNVMSLSSKANVADASFNSQMSDALKAEQAAKANLYEQNRAVVDIMEKNMPKSPLSERIVQHARTSMLSSLGGRVFAMSSTLGANLPAYLSDKTLSALFGNVRNIVKGTNEVKTSFARPTTLVKGAGHGFKSLTKAVWGKAPVKSVDAHVKGMMEPSSYAHDNTRYGWIGQHITAPLRKAVQTGVGSHLAATEGVRDVELEQAARQAIKDLNIPKENQQGWIDFYKQHAPSSVQADANEAHLAVNNLHKNGVTDFFSGVNSRFNQVGKNIADPKERGIIQGIAKSIKTVLLPFPHYAGGLIQKGFTDRNLLYNVYRMARARSPQEFADQLGKFGTNVGAGIGLGYMGAKTGLITNHDQNGKNYDGFYFHIGNKYISGGIAGQLVSPIVAGAEFYNSIQDGSHGLSWPKNVLESTFKATGAASTFGAYNPLSLGQGGVVPGIIHGAGTAIRQHIPGILGDVNAGLDYSSLNPTHEAPQTKATVENPQTHRQNTDELQTEINKTKASIPGLRQGLPRKTGELAPSEIDRMLHAGDSSPAQLKAAQDAQAVQNQSQYDLANDIPDPHGNYDSSKGESFMGSVQNKISNNEYDKAITGLTQKLNSYGSDNKVDPSTKKTLKNLIGQLNVTKKFGSNGQSVRALYLSTNLSNWRAMGDPTSDSYDPKTYALLYNYSTQLSNAGVGGSGNDQSKNKYYAKKSGSGSGGKSKNTIGSTPNLAMLDFSGLTPEKITNAPIPTINPIMPGQLIKKRAISVTRRAY